MRKMIRKEASALFEKSQALPSVTVTEADLGGMPEPAQRYLRYARVLDKEFIRTIRLK